LGTYGPPFARCVGDILDSGANEEVVMTETSEIVVVGVDGSKQSDAAVAWADRYARFSGSTVVLVCAWEWANAYGYPMMFEGYHPDAEAAKLVEKAQAALTVPAEQVRTVVQEGPAGKVLVESATDAGLLVVGTHGHRGVNSILLGSVSSYCLHHAHCPVLVVR
jgi:nucleotide-binding universal stress UspA family protein